MHEEKILLIHHRKLDKWLSFGSNIEFDEAPVYAGAFCFI
jgi:hypothetical protein